MTTGGRMHIAFLGCGKAADMHARRLRRLTGGRVRLSFASREGARAEQARARHHGERSFASYEGAMDAGDVTVAFVTTPTALHLELTLQALASGKHVIVEKPAFMSVEEADAARDAALRAKRQVCVAENYFYKPIARHIRDAIGRGDLGDVRFVHVNATKWQSMTGWRADARLAGGGALFEGGVHWVNFLANLGLDVVEVQHHQAGGRDGPELSSLVMFRYANGAIGTLVHSWELRAPLKGMRLSKVQGTRGSVTFESNGFAWVTTGRRPSARASLRDTLGYDAMLRDFLHALNAGDAPQFSLELARRDLELLETRPTPAI